MTTLPQLLYIHGGMTFPSREAMRAWLATLEISLDAKKRWSDTLATDLEGVYEVIKPRMPMKEDAQYIEWKIYFERHLPLLRDGVVLVGNSLGGIFLAKYLSEHEVPLRVAAVLLVCPPFDNSLSDEDLLGGFELGEDLSLLTRQAERVLLYFSEDDPVVPAAHADKYQQALPDAEVVMFPSKNGHFQVETFPEIVNELRGIARVHHM